MRHDPETRAARGPLDRLWRHRYGRFVEPLADEPSLLVKSMFGCVACYAHGRLKLVLADRRPPWRGVLVPTLRQHHATLCADVAGLATHPVLRKWLHVPESADDFEAAVDRLVTLALLYDPRIGVEPPPRKSRRARARPDDAHRGKKSRGRGPLRRSRRLPAS